MAVRTVLLMTTLGRIVLASLAPNVLMTGLIHPRQIHLTLHLPHVALPLTKILPPPTLINLTKLTQLMTTLLATLIFLPCLL